MKEHEAELVLEKVDLPCCESWRDTSWVELFRSVLRVVSGGGDDILSLVVASGIGPKKVKCLWDLSNRGYKRIDKKALLGEKAVQS